MNGNLIKNLGFVVVGAILVAIVELKLFHFNETITLIMGLIGFVALVEGVFGLYNLIRKGPKGEVSEEVLPK